MPYRDVFCPTDDRCHVDDLGSEHQKKKKKKKRTQPITNYFNTPAESPAGR